MAYQDTSTSDVAIHPSSEKKDPEPNDYVFGFGSIMNTFTHAPWLADHTTTSVASTTTLYVQRACQDIERTSGAIAAAGIFNRIRALQD